MAPGFLNVASCVMDPNFVEINTKFSADLHPSTLRDVKGSFQSILDDLLLTYNAQLGGIILAYHNEKILSKTASVHAFFPYFHVDAETTLSVLRLEKDKHLGVLRAATAASTLLHAPMLSRAVHACQRPCSRKDQQASTGLHWHASAGRLQRSGL